MPSMDCKCCILVACTQPIEMMLVVAAVLEPACPRGRTCATTAYIALSLVDMMQVEAAVAGPCWSPGTHRRHLRADCGRVPPGSDGDQRALHSRRAPVQWAVAALRRCLHLPHRLGQGQGPARLPPLLPAQGALLRPFRLLVSSACSPELHEANGQTELSNVKEQPATSC